MSSTEAKCANHPDTAATETCPRCGTFSCDRCAAPNRWCTACQQWARSNVPPLRDRAKIAVVLAWATAVTDVALLALLAAWKHTGSAQLGSRYEQLDLVFSGVGFASNVALIVWLHRAIRHANARGIFVGISPREAVVAFFIPGVDLVRPFQAALRLSRAFAANAPIAAWWLIWALGSIAAWASLYLGEESPFALRLELAVLGLDLIGCAITAAVVTRITVASEARVSPS